MIVKLPLELEIKVASTGALSPKNGYVGRGYLLGVHICTAYAETETLASERVVQHFRQGLTKLLQAPEWML